MRICFLRKTRDVFLSPVKARKGPCMQSCRAMAAHTFPWMQGHALLPLAVCGVTGEALPMGIFPTGHGGVLSLIVVWKHCVQGKLETGLTAESFSCQH